MNLDYLIIGCIAAAVLLLIVGKYYSNKQSKQFSFTIYTKKKKKKVSNTWAYKVYQLYRDIPVVRGYTQRIFHSLELLYPNDRRKCIRDTSIILSAVFGVSILAILAVAIFDPTIYMFAVVVMTIYVVTETVIAKVLDYHETKLLTQLNNFIDLLQYNYLNSQMVEIALQDSVCGKNKMVEEHVNQIRKVLSSSDIDTSMMLYVNSVSNKYLKELCMICITIYTYGDVTDSDGMSLFMSNLKRLKERVIEDMRQRKDTAYKFKFLVPISVFPLYFVDPIKNWAISNVPQLQSFYAGYYGAVSTVVMLIVSVAIYMVINAMKTENNADLSDHTILFMVSRFAPVKKYLQAFYNTNYGLYLRTKRLLRSIGSKLTPETLAVKRALFAVVAFLATTGFLFAVNISVKERATNELSGKSTQSNAAGEEDMVKMIMLNYLYTDYYVHDVDPVDLYNEKSGSHAYEYDEKVHEWFKTYLQNLFQYGLFDVKEDMSDVTKTQCNMPLEISDEQALEVIHYYNAMYSESTTLYTAYLGSDDGDIREHDEKMIEEGYKQLKEFQESIKQSGMLTVDLFYEYVAEDIADRTQKYYNSYFKWWMLLIALCCGLVAFFIPYVWILINKSNSQTLMAEEVLQFMSTILVLKSIPGLGVTDLMNWLLNFASIYSQTLNRCIIDIPRNEHAAFERAIDSEPYEQFQNLMRNMEMCDEVGIRQAFSSLDITRKGFVESSQQARDQKTSSNAAMGQMLAMVPLFLAIGLFMIYPFVKDAFGELTTSLYQMTNH